GEVVREKLTHTLHKRLDKKLHERFNKTIHNFTDGQHPQSFFNDQNKIGQQSFGFGGGQQSFDGGGMIMNKEVITNIRKKIAESLREKVAETVKEKLTHALR